MVACDDLVMLESVEVGQGSRAEIVPEGGGWSVFVPGLPVAADGETRDAAIMEMVAALREYARDWHDHLHDAPNHRENRDLVQLIGRSDNQQLRDWLVVVSGSR